MKWTNEQPKAQGGMMKNLQKPKEITITTPPVPTQEGPGGLRYDFNCGLRVILPEGGPYLVAAVDTDTGTAVLDKDAIGGAAVTSKEKYYVPFAFTVYDYGKQEVLFQHRMDLRGQVVLVLITVKTLGDTLAWMPQVEAFRESHGCDLYLIASAPLREILEKQYPDIHFINAGEESAITPYATYKLGLSWSDEADAFRPVDHRLCSLSDAAAYILGNEPIEIKPRLDLSAPRMIDEPYVCIAVQSSMASKNWTAQGWLDVVRFLKQCGYRVLCIDKEAVCSDGRYTTAIPNGAEDLTGNFSLQDRINQIKDADFFIGLSSGLSWLAWGCNVPVIMIGGFSEPYSEFKTPYRVINRHACHGCWNDVRHSFVHTNWAWCPRHQDTEREHECMLMISPKQVIDAIKRCMEDLQ